MMENKFKVIDFSETRELLIGWGYPNNDLTDRQFVNFDNILSVAKTFGSVVKWKQIPDWYSFEMGNIDIDPEQFIAICFAGLSYADEILIIVTMESYNSDKVFVVPYTEFQEFADNYSEIIGEHVLFVQAMDHIFMLTKQCKIVLVHHEGAYTQIDVQAENL